MLAVVLVIVGAALMVAGRSGRDGATDREVPNLVLDLNEAPAGLLSALPGVGRGLARRIVDERRARPFASTADLGRRTHGVGPATLARLEPHLRVEVEAVELGETERLARAE